MVTAVTILAWAGVLAGALADQTGNEEGDRRCLALLDTLWRATLPARQALDVVEEQRLREEYGRKEKFLERCRALTAQELDCLHGHPQPLIAFSDCCLRAGQRESLAAPSLLRLLEEVKPPDPVLGGEQLAAQLEGIWRNSWPEGRSSIFWRINRRGRIAETRQGPDGATSQRHLQIAGGGAGQLVVDVGDGRQERWPWLRLGPRRMIVGRHLPHTLLVPLVEGRARIQYNRVLLVIKEQQCLAIGEAGALASAECHWEWEKSRRRLLVEWTHPETGVPQRAVFYLLAGYLAEEKLVRSGWFEKKP